MSRSLTSWGTARCHPFRIDLLLILTFRLTFSGARSPGRRWRVLANRRAHLPAFFFSGFSQGFVDDRVNGLHVHPIENSRWGHPIIFLSSFNFATRVHRALSAFEKTISRTASLSLDSNPAPNRYRYPAYFFQSPIIPYPGCRSSVREAPNIVPHEVHWPPRC